MDVNIRDNFADSLKAKLKEGYTLRWDIDSKGVVDGWCRLSKSDDIVKVAECVAALKGRVMLISAMITKGDEKQEHIEIAYHFYFDKVNFTATISIPENTRKVKSITPVLKSADWHEREMRDLYKIEPIGHPNPKRLFLDESIHLDPNAMVPLSAAMNGTSTSTLWEQVMKSNIREGESDE